MTTKKKTSKKKKDRTKPTHIMTDKGLEELPLKKFYKNSMTKLQQLTKKELRIKKGLVLCENCDTPASWEHSIACGWVGCSPCILGESKSFDIEDLIAEEYISDFLEEFNEINKKHD